MVAPTRPPANGFVAAARKLYNPLGFSKGYNFTLFFILAGAFMGFTLARLPYLDYFGRFRQDKGNEAYYFRPGVTRIGMMLHLFTVLPAAFLACFQFVPVIRHRASLFHRVNGYAVLLLSLVSIVGALMIARHAMGGDMSVQLGTGFASIVFVGSLVMAYVNIKRLQIEQHRAWMLRAWVIAGSIITLRLILVIMMMINRTRGYYTIRECDHIDFEVGGDRDRLLNAFPSCGAFYNGSNPHASVMVRADPAAGPGGLGSALTLNFGAAFWLALAIHMIGVEIYLRLTPAEAERLRNVSYQRQVEAGMKHPGRAGLTVDRLGDSAKWVPESKQATGTRDSASDLHDTSKAESTPAR